MIKKAAEYIKIPKKLFFGVIIAAVVLLALSSLKPKHLPVDLGQIKEGTFQRLVVDEGITHFKNRQVVSAPADGITPKQTMEVGDPVKKGQVLFKFLWDKDFPMKSEVDGYILKIYEQDRRHVPRGTPIMEVGDPESIEVHAKILSEEVIEIKLDQKVLIKNWGKDQPLEAKVVRVDPAAKEEVSALGVKEQRVRVHMNLTSPKEMWQGLGDGFRVEVSVVTDEAPGSKLLPVGALISADGKPAIYLYQDKKAILTPIEIEGQNRNFALLKSEIPIGSQVILYPGSEIQDGIKVRPRKQ